MEQETGLEPAMSPWKGEVLPLHYSCEWCSRQDLNLHAVWQTLLRRPCMPFHHLSKNAGLVLAPRVVGLSKFLPTFLPTVASLAALTNLPEVDHVPEGGGLTARRFALPL